MVFPAGHVTDVTGRNFAAKGTIIIRDVSAVQKPACSALLGQSDLDTAHDLKPHKKHKHIKRVRHKPSVSSPELPGKE